MYLLILLFRGNEPVAYMFDSDNERTKYMNEKKDILQTCLFTMANIIPGTTKESPTTLECKCVGDNCLLKKIDINKLKIKHLKKQ